MPSPAERSTFYRAAFLGLLVLDTRETTRSRFGPDVDARWKSFAGDLDAADRIDLLLRDAAHRWKYAFSPALVFSLPGLAQDEPFGPDWQSLPVADADRLFAAPPAPTLSSGAECLGVPVASVSLPAITPATRLRVAGGAAVHTVAGHFANHPGLDWASQVIVIADAPAVRQFAGLAALFVGSTSATVVVSSAAKAGLGIAVVSADASPDERAAAGK